MSVSVDQILESHHFRAALDRIKDNYTQTVMASGTAPEARQVALMKFHLLDELEVDLSQHKQE